MAKDKPDGSSVQDLLAEAYGGVRRLNAADSAGSPSRTGQSAHAADRPPVRALPAAHRSPEQPNRGASLLGMVDRELLQHAEKRAQDAENALLAERNRHAATQRSLVEAEKQVGDLKSSLEQAESERDAAKTAAAEAEKARGTAKMEAERLEASRRSFQAECLDLRAKLDRIGGAPAVLPAAPAAAEPANAESEDSQGAIADAMRRFTSECLNRGYKKIVFVGGSPAYRKQLDLARDARMQFRFVDGNSKAVGDIPSADLVINWGASELDHAVSLRFPEALLIPNRGITGMLRLASDRLKAR